MGFLEDIGNIKKSEQDYWREFVEIVDMLPGLKDVFDDYMLDLHWLDNHPSLLTYEEEGSLRKYIFPMLNIATVTISVEDGSPYKVVFQDKKNNSWKLELQYDSKSKIEIACEMERRITSDKVEARRNPEMLEQVEVTYSYPRWNDESSFNVIKETRDISEGCCGDDENKCDIATLNAVVKHGLFGRIVLERGQIFDTRNMQSLQKAVEKSDYLEQCCKYDKTVAKMFARIQ